MTRPWHAALLLVLLAGVAAAEPVTVVRESGPSANRVDVVVLGDGYRLVEWGQYFVDVEAIVAQMFTEEPFDEYAPYFNVRRIHVASAESGADHPEATPPTFRDTALDATFDCGGVARCICVNHTKTLDVLTRSLPPDQRDVVVVLVNDPVYGGCATAFAVSSLHADAADVVLHEVGHTFGQLGDEYGGSNDNPSCIPTIEPPQVNVTRETEREHIKWRHWIDPTTPIPTLGPTTALPGLYEGARYCNFGLFRPTYLSKMRSHSVPFEQVNAEQLVRRVYNWVSPIDAVSPADTGLTVADGKRIDFGVDTLVPLTHDLEITWTVNGAPAGDGPALSLKFDSSVLGPGPYEVEVTVHDPTPLVRLDPDDVLSDAWRWTVVLSGEPLAAPKAATRCQEALAKLARKLVDHEQVRAERCVGEVFRCVQREPGDAECLAEAAAACDDQAAARDVDRAKLVDGVQERCAGVPTSDLLDAHGLGWSAAAPACAAYGVTLEGLGDVADCVARSHRCAAEELLARGRPRAGELFRLAGAPDDSEGCRLDLGGVGDGVADPDTARTLVGCGKAMAAAARKVAGARLKAIASCADAVFACTQLSPGDTRCLERARTRCARVAERTEARQPKLVSGAGKRCLGVPLEVVRLAEALYVEPVLPECAAVGVSATSLTRYRECLRRLSDCRAVELAGLQIPRVEELLALGGQPLAPDYCPAAP